jgi:hypothetical protein
MRVPTKQEIRDHRLARYRASVDAWLNGPADGSGLLAFLEETSQGPVHESADVTHGREDLQPHEAAVGDRDLLNSVTRTQGESLDSTSTGLLCPATHNMLSQCANDAELISAPQPAPRMTIDGQIRQSIVGHPQRHDQAFVDSAATSTTGSAHAHMLNSTMYPAAPLTGPFLPPFPPAPRRVLPSQPYAQPTLWGSHQPAARTLRQPLGPPLQATNGPRGPPQVSSQAQTSTTTLPAVPRVPQSVVATNSPSFPRSRMPSQVQTPTQTAEEEVVEPGIVTPRQSSTQRRHQLPPSDLANPLRKLKDLHADRVGLLVRSGGLAETELKGLATGIVRYA